MKIEINIRRLMAALFLAVSCLLPWIVGCAAILLSCAPRTYTHYTIVNIPDTLAVRVLPAVVDSAEVAALEQKRLEKEKEAERIQAAEVIVAWFEKAFGYLVFDHRGDFSTWFELEYSVPEAPRVYKWVRYEFFPERHAWEPTANWEE